MKMTMLNDAIDVTEFCIEGLRGAAKKSSIKLKGGVGLRHCHTKKKLFCAASPIGYREKHFASHSMDFVFWNFDTFVSIYFLGGLVSLQIMYAVSFDK